MADYTDKEIRDYVGQLQNKGASLDDIEAFVAHAKGQAVIPAAPAAGAGQAAGPDAADRPDFIPQSHPQTFHGPEELRPQAPNLGRVIDAGLEGGGAMVGQAVGAIGGPFAEVTMPVGGALGAMAGNTAGQLRRGGDFKWGELMGAGVSGAIPGGPLAGAGAKGLAKEAGKFAAGGLAAKATETGIDEGRLPTAGEATLAAGAGAAGPLLAKGLDKGVTVAAWKLKQIQNSVRDVTLAEAKAAGYVIPPSRVDPSAINNALESFAGKAATAQEAAARNQEITNALARKEIGAPVSAPLTEGLLNQVRADAGKVYQKVASFSPQASADLEALKQARFDAKEYFKFYERSGDPAALKTARVAGVNAAALENHLEQAALQNGQPGLIDELRAARVRIAKTYEVEKALNLGDGNIDASVLGRSLDRGSPLTGGLETAAKFQQAFPQSAREAARTPTAGVSKLKAVATGILAGGGAMQFGPAGLAAGAIPFLDGPARSILLSKPYQAMLARPRYPGLGLADMPADFIRRAVPVLGR